MADKKFLARQKKLLALVGQNYHYGLAVGNSGIDPAPGNKELQALIDGGYVTVYCREGDTQTVIFRSGKEFT